MEKLLTSFLTAKILVKSQWFTYDGNSKYRSRGRQGYRPILTRYTCTLGRWNRNRRRGHSRWWRIYRDGLYHL